MESDPIESTCIFQDNSVNKNSGLTKLVHLYSEMNSLGLLKSNSCFKSFCLVTVLAEIDMTDTK